MNKKILKFNEFINESKNKKSLFDIIEKIFGNIEDYHQDDDDQEIVFNPDGPDAFNKWDEYNEGESFEDSGYKFTIIKKSDAPILSVTLQYKKL